MAPSWSWGREVAALVEVERRRKLNLFWSRIGGVESPPPLSGIRGVDVSPS